MSRPQDKSEVSRVFLWSIPAIVPTVTLLFSFILSSWSWGLMDDLQILNLHGNIFQKTWSYFMTFFHFGEFKIVWSLHCAVFYSLFHNAPKLFYIFKLIEVIGILLIWGSAAYRITGRKIAIAILATVTLSFHYFYDVFFYLSSHEYLGLLFVGIAVHFLLNSLRGLCPDRENEAEEQMRFGWGAWFLCVLFLFFSYGCKEPFISCGIAFGTTLLVLSCMKRKTGYFKPLFLSGLFLIAATILYAFILLFYIRSGHTSQYSFSNVPKLLSNLNSWMKKDFLNHLPWILIASVIYWISKGKFSKNKKNTWYLTGFLLGLFLYLGFLLVLLPWNATCYYASPLGLFFGFFIAVILSTRILKLNFAWHILLVLAALILNQMVSQYALVREAAYQYDTIHLLEWLEKNPILNKKNKSAVCCNGMEASGAIPGHLTRNTQVRVDKFIWATNPNQRQKGRFCDYFLYSPRFGMEKLEKLKNWEVSFYTKNWKMYIRPKDQKEKK